MDPIHQTMQGAVSSAFTRRRPWPWFSLRALPVVERELRVAARRPKTYRARWMSALVALFVGAWMLLVFTQMRGIGMPAWQVFQSISQFALVLVLFTGITHTADSLSEEKREGTLGLLFLTDLKPHDIVLGKLLATSLHTLYGLLAMLPVFSLVFFLGAVSGTQLWQLGLGLMNALFFSLVVGLFVSSFSRRARVAGGAATMIIVVFWLGLRGLSEWLRDLDSGVEWADRVMLLNPASPVDAAFFNGQGFWPSLLVTHGLAWAFFAATCAILPRAWQDKAAGPTGVRWIDRLRQWSFGNPYTRATFRTRLLDLNAFLWLAARHRLGPMLTWLLVGAIPAAGAFGWWYMQPSFEMAAACTLTTLALHAYLKLEFAGNAARRFAEDRHSGAIELILSTPLTVREILRGQFQALRLHYQWPVAAALLLDLAGLGLLGVFGENEFPEVGGRSWIMAALIIFGLRAVMLVADLVALGWMSMWTGLNARQPSHATGPAVFWVLVMPWVILNVCMAVLGILQVIWARGLTFWHFAAAWFALGVLADAAAIFYARRRLLRDFRVVATQRFQPPRPGWWSRLLRRENSP